MTNAIEEAREALKPFAAAYERARWLAKHLNPSAGDMEFKRLPKEQTETVLFRDLERASRARAALNQETGQ